MLIIQSDPGYNVMNGYLYNGKGVHYTHTMKRCFFLFFFLYFMYKVGIKYKLSKYNLN